MSTELADRTFGDAFSRYWAPVIAPSARALLDRLDGTLSRDEAIDILDVGTGTGTLAIAALERWPQARVTAIDPSERMLELAREEAERRGRELGARLELLTGYGDELPAREASADLVISSFVIQLVDDRQQMVREISRVLRPGGTAAVVTWRGTRERFEPDRVVMRAFDELRIDVPDDPDDTRPYASVREAEREFRRAGFAEIDARIVLLEHSFSPDEYLAVAENWFDRETFDELDEPMRARLHDLLERRLNGLAPAELLWRRELVSVVARREG